MKKISFILSFLLTFCTLSYGKVVPVNTAKTVAYNYLHQKGASLTSADDLQLVYTSGNSNAYFYVFSGSNCFVLVTAEDGVTPVLGYSTNRAFHGDNIPANATGFFENYNKQIDYVINNNVAATPEIASKWDELVTNKKTTTAAKTTTVPPLLTTTWDQAPNYNANCPYDAGAGARCVTGCVATATAQVMKFWNWPAHGTGMNSYTTSSYGTLSADFGSSTYNWASMPVPAATGANAAVAKLMSDVGISVNMDYSPTESSSYVISAASPITNCAEYALKTYFNYDPSLHGEMRSSYSDPTWTSMLQSELDASRPVIYFGTGTSGGHCFVFDGYDAPGNFHVNWGWSGTGPDGYYTIDALNPPSLGAGGGGGGFNSDQGAIFGVKPNTTGAAPASLQLYDYVNLSAPSVFYSAAFTVSTNIENTGSTTFTGDFCAAAFDGTTGAFVSFIDSVMGTTLPPGDAFVSDLSFPTTGLLAMLPGNYIIAAFYRSTGGSWIQVPDYSPFYFNSASLTVYNSNFIELYSPMSPTPTPFVQGSPATVTLTAYNNSAVPWDDSLYLGVFNLDGTGNCDVQALPATSIGAYGSTGTLTFSTSSITATPGTYFLALQFKYMGTWYLAGSDYASNPIYINVVAPPPAPDMYEVNNTAGTAYDLTSTLTWVSDVAHTGTPGSNFHVVTDQDYYKLVLAPGYNYAITARVNDDVSADDGLPYTVDAVWSYSKDGGATWSSVYDDVMAGTINFSGLTGGTVIFHVSPHFPGDIGTYLLKIGNIVRTSSTLALPEADLSAARIYPNPVSDIIAVDLSGTNAKGISSTLTDVTGKKVFAADAGNQAIFTIPVNSLSPGIYFLAVSTDAGMINKKITVGSK